MSRFSNVVENIMLLKRKARGMNVSKVFFTVCRRIFVIKGDF